MAMISRMFAFARHVRRTPWLALSWLLAVVALGYVVFAPFAVARYPMMTDLPFHAANASVFAHYSDAGYHFREQFVLQPFAVPYLAQYLLAALFMQFVSALSAIKLASALLLSLLPLGLGVLAHGMRKSPLLGLSGLTLVWCKLTSWGFINFVAALGLFAMALGAALCVLDRGEVANGRARRRGGWQLFLATVLLVLLITHPFRFPFAIAAIGLAALLLYPLRGGFRGLLWPVALPSALFALWWFEKPQTFNVDWGPLSPDWSRLSQAPDYIFRSLNDPAQDKAASWALAALALLSLALLVRRARRPLSSATARQWSRRVHLLACLSVAGFALGYLVLPMEVASWWYIYPREATACAMMSLALIPDLPRKGWPHLLAVAIVAGASMPLARLTLDSHRHFDTQTASFAAIQQHLPRAPKLLYLVFDHSGSRAATTPFIHLPAYIQADRGGWLSFHFASLGGSPIRYRDDGGSVPPAVPRRWEWTPHRFRMRQHGAFFDWFLIRHSRDPAPLLNGSDRVELVANEGKWWLYRRNL